MSNEQRIKEAHEHLESLMWDDYTQRLFNMAAFARGRQTKNLTSDEVDYIVDGLNYKGKFRQEWEGREEFMWRFLDMLVARGSSRTLLSATIASSARGLNYNAEERTMADITYSDWVKEANQITKLKTEYV